MPHKTKLPFPKTKFITGIRAYAALAVFTIHFRAGGIADLGEVARRIVDFGRYGVVVFFIISAFTICLSIENRGDLNYVDYIKRRFFRIYPLYVTSILAALIVYNINFQTVITDLIWQLSLLSLFAADSRNTILAVTWTIPLEFAYYFFIPLMFKFMSKKTSYLIMSLIVAVIISLVSIKFAVLPYAYNATDPGLVLHFSLERYALVYIATIAFYIFVSKTKRFNVNSSLLLSLLVLLVVYITIDVHSIFSDLLFVSLWTFTLIYFCYARSWLSVLLFENPIVIHLGNISYSIYLSHLIIHSILPSSWDAGLFYLAGLALTILVSTVSYYMIEVPYINFAKNLTLEFPNNAKFNHWWRRFYRYKFK